jgi:predicted O-linked N-acetylglucosamine transferase (SPINDLY family)/glycosyltransferase involved in cell wall biosynthesis
MAKPPLLNPSRRQSASAVTKHRAARGGQKKLPSTAQDLKELGQRLRKEGKFDEARDMLRKAAEAAPRDHQPWVMLGYLDLSQSMQDSAQKHFERALELQPDDPDAHQGLATIFYMSSRNGAGLRHIDRTLEKKPNHVPALVCKVQLLTRLFRMEEAAALSEKLIRTDIGDPERNATHWNDLGNIKRGMGQLKEAEDCYRKAASLTKTDPVPLSNCLTIMHYMPDRSPLDILEVCKEWARRFAPAVAAKRPVPADLSPGRKLRVGMYSDGFRQHPVGAMTTSALEHLAKLGFELHLYASNNRVDTITQRLMAIATRWTGIANIRDEELARRIREDGIDILMDLSGHNAGNRIRTMTLQPAPILVKWVGGLINTTGVEAIDYLLTDSIESPAGSDALFTEKLVRMPDDYICYLPPDDAPDVVPLPALKNGHITFGCFNNPAKVNEIVLARWAGLMNALPGSHLYLKGGAYDSEELRQRVLHTLESHGVDPQRVRLEGQSVHHELLQCYNEIDIALDPWPYSGGLTTCEALLMGVPVVTLPGPTFAGRHSATHLINAGMPELVVEDWDQYHARVLGLAGDLQSLATIRGHLRRVLLESPVCDGARFGRNLASALRAIWQRYCEGKAPAALAFTSDGKPQFDGDEVPMVLQQPEPEHDERQSDGASFDFTFQGQIVTMDHGGALIGKQPALLNQRGAFQAVVLDPAGQIANADMLQRQVHHYQAHIALGDGEPAVLYACLDAALSGTLEPLPAMSQLPFTRQGATVLAKLPIPTTRLDSIDGLQPIDWLGLNDTHDNLKILRGAQAHLDHVLAVQVAVLFTEVFSGQPDMHAVTALLRQHGLRLLRIDQARYRSYFSGSSVHRTGQDGSQLFSADAVFVPDEPRIKSLDANRKAKLAFILHAGYGATDLAHHVLALADQELAGRFLVASGWSKESVAAPGVSPAAPAASVAAEKNEPAAPGGSVMEAPGLLLSPATRRPTYVGVPVYNEEKYIEQTVKSLKDQDVDGVGFLICDNASTDRTREIIRDTAGSDERFTLVRHASNIGALENFRYAFENTDSKYFMWLGGHDYLSEGYLKSTLDALGATPGIAMACGMPYGVTESRIAAVPSAVYDFPDDSPIVRYMNSVVKLANCTILHSLFRRSYLNGFEIKETVSWDHVLISRLLWKGKLAYAADAKYFRRYFSQRASTTEQRMTAGKKTLPRADFYDYYTEDFSNLAKRKLPAADLRARKDEMLRVLKARFEK